MDEEYDVIVLGTGLTVSSQASFYSCTNAHTRTQRDLIMLAL